MTQSSKLASGRRFDPATNGAGTGLLDAKLLGVTGILVSGGLDSAILVGSLLSAGRSVQPFYIRSGLFWEPDEQRALKAFLARIQSEKLAPLITFELPLGDVYRDHWSITGNGVPGADTDDGAVYLPGRNALLVIKAALWCQLHGIERLALASLGCNPFADSSAGFFHDLESALNHNLAGGLRLERPFSGLSKGAVMQLGSDLPIHLTFSCIRPVQGVHCGQCNKCAERQRAFRLADRADPTEYAFPPPRE